MGALAYLIPVSLGLGIVGLVAFLWNLKNGQYEDLSGAAERILDDEDNGPNQPPPNEPPFDPTHM